MSLLIDIVTTTAAVAFGYWFSAGTQRWNWSRCKCGRSKPPWFYRAHEREALMVLWAVMTGTLAVIISLAGPSVVAVLMGLFCLWHCRIIQEHRKGKKSILGRLAGRVVVTEHGRLAVQR